MKSLDTYAPLIFVGGQLLLNSLKGSARTASVMTRYALDLGGRTTKVPKMYSKSTSVIGIRGALEEEDSPDPDPDIFLSRTPCNSLTPFT
ncbi:ORF1302 [White spot syndrome virus]|uniref:ORF1302 n=1 Tax=White spot syndrome virus TaxID=342409 RepID=A0A2D3I5T8_9VIRU|nr:ORF1302 [White spot syndrome virus]